MERINTSFIYPGSKLSTILFGFVRNGLICSKLCEMFQPSAMSLVQVLVSYDLAHILAGKFMLQTKLISYKITNS